MKLPNLISIFVAASILANAVSTLAADKPTIKEMLAAKIDFEWNNDSLELGLLALEAKVKADYPDFRIKIIGDDLKLDGITKNQRIHDLKMEDKTIAEVLTAIVLKAAPNSLAKNPADPRLKLVWGIAADPDQPGIQSVVITTREGARRRGEKLPKIFGPN